MRILLYTSEFPPVVGGISSYCQNLALGLMELGQDVSVLTCGPSSHSTSHPYPVHRYMAPISGRGRYVFDVWHLNRSIRLCRPEVLLFSGTIALRTLALTLPLWNRIKIPIFYGSEVHHHIERTMWMRDLRRICISCDQVWPISEYTRDLLLKHVSISPDKSRVIYPSIVSTPTPSPELLDRIRSIYGLARNSSLLTVSRLVPRKGHSYVIQCLPQLRQSLPNVRYLIAGSGPTRDELEKMAHGLGVADTVVFLGSVSETELAAHYATCDLFIMLGVQTGNDVEGFGMTYLEAALHKKPSIASFHGGADEAVIHGETGLIVDPTDRHALVNEITRLLAKPELRMEMGVRAYERARKMFHPRAIARTAVCALSELHEA